MANHGLSVNYNYMRDDLTKNLPDELRFLDQAATIALQQNSIKYRVFKEWLINNGAVFDDAIEFPAVFGGGLQGLAAKKPLGTHKGYIFIPNTIILSVERVKACPEFRNLIKDNFELFGEGIHPDREQMLLATFLLYHHLKGDASFWKPYIDVMNAADLVCNWPEDEID